MRGSEWTTYHFGFNAPPAGCDLLVQFIASTPYNEGTRVTYDDIQLRKAQALGPALTPSYAFKVYEEPTQTLALSGAGTLRLQAYSAGTWQAVGKAFVLDPTTPVELTIPERFSGRNVHLGYHDGHITQLVSLDRRTRGAYPFLIDYARRWAAMAPGTGWQVPRLTPTARMRSQTAPVDVDRSVDDLPLLDQFTGLPYDELMVDTLNPAG